MPLGPCHGHDPHTVVVHFSMYWKPVIFIYFTSSGRNSPCILWIRVELSVHIFFFHVLLPVVRRGAMCIRYNRNIMSSWSHSLHNTPKGEIESIMSYLSFICLSRCSSLYKKRKRQDIMKLRGMYHCKPSVGVWLSHAKSWSVLLYPRWKPPMRASPRP